MLLLSNMFVSVVLNFVAFYGDYCVSLNDEIIETDIVNRTLM